MVVSSSRWGRWMRSSTAAGEGVHHEEVVDQVGRLPTPIAAATRPWWASTHVYWVGILVED